jgi:hypothetical protein
LLWARFSSGCENTTPKYQPEELLRTCFSSTTLRRDDNNPDASDLLLPLLDLTEQRSILTSPPHLLDWLNSAEENLPQQFFSSRQDQKERNAAVNPETFSHLTCNNVGNLADAFIQSDLLSSMHTFFTYWWARGLKPTGLALQEPCYVDATYYPGFYRHNSARLISDSNSLLPPHLCFKNRRPLLFIQNVSMLGLHNILNNFQYFNGCW